MEARGFSKEDFARFHPAGQLGRNLLLEVGDVIIAEGAGLVQEGAEITGAEEEEEGV